MYFVAPIAAPRAITGVAISPNAIFLQWSRLSSHQLRGILTGYDIYVYDSAQRARRRQLIIEDKEAVNVTVTSLAPYTEYEVTVSARTGGGTGPRGPSPPLLITTQQDGRTCQYCICLCYECLVFQYLEFLSLCMLLLCLPIEFELIGHHRLIQMAS